jgi:ribonuclease H2 subunit A
MQGDIEVGIDEAGRGPVLGPMVYGGVAWPVSARAHFTKLGFKDSKQLTEEDRDELFKLIGDFNGELLHSKAIVSNPLDITFEQLSYTKVSLNTISHNCAKSIIRHFLSLGLRVKAAYLDTVGDEKKYKELMEYEFRDVVPNIEFTVESKADDTYPVVSAASIVAKVTRDIAIKDFVIKEKLPLVSREFGSGYPGDPNTVKWLNDHFDSFFGYPNVVRFSWSTITKRLEEKNIVYSFQEDIEPDGCITKRFDTKQGTFMKRIGNNKEFVL